MAEITYRNAITRSVAKNRSATRPTKNGETSDAIDTVENTHPAWVPVNPRVCVRYVVIVTYHAPQMTYCRNIITHRRIFSMGATRVARARNESAPGLPLRPRSGSTAACRITWGFS